MATTMGGRAAEFLLSEAPGTLSREEITVVSGQNLVSGTLLGKVTASSKYIAYDDGADPADGSETAAGILLYDCDATDGDQKAVMIARNAEVASAKLTGSDANGLADLAALTIIARA
jgi:hypothetical protein